MARTGRGYTFLEVLIAAAIVVVVVGLLIPAVMKVRSAAERARCFNNLKRLGTATLAYHDARGHFPAGGSEFPCLTAATPPAREAGGWSWAYGLLPHLGHDAEYRDPDPGAVRTTPLGVFLCPARRATGRPGTLAKLDYAANGRGDADSPTGVIAPTGVPPLRYPDIRDGSAGLVLFAGRRLNRAALGVSLDDDDAYPTAGWGADYEIHRTAAVPPAPDVDEPGVFSAHAGFGSSHPGVFCAGFADGTVRPIRYTLDPDVWRRACLRTGAALPPPQNND